MMSSRSACLRSRSRSAQKFGELRAAGFTLRLDNVRRWYRAVNGLASGMDHASGKHLAALFARAAPW